MIRIALSVLALGLVWACSPASPSAPAQGRVQAAAPAAGRAPAPMMKMICRSSQDGRDVPCGTADAVMVGMKPR